MPRYVAVLTRWCVLCAGLALSACRHIPAPVPDPTLLGCYRLNTNLAPSYADSLGYHLPTAIQLAATKYNQWIVYPTDPEWHPDWTDYDDLPSTRVRRQRAAATGSPVIDPERFESSNRIPGDSIDIRFPSAVGQLVLRLGRHENGLRGRAEWVVTPHEYFLNEGVVVQAPRTACSDVPRALVRNRRSALTRLGF